MKALELITYSTLCKYGGGIESWLFKFLSYSKQLLAYYDKIYIFGLKSKDKDLISESINDPNIHFIYAKNHYSLNLIKILLFCYKVSKIISCHSKKFERLDIISIHTIYQTIPMFLVNKKNIRRIIWLRSILPKQIHVLQIRKIKPLILFMEKYFLSHSNIIIANGEDTKSFYESFYSIHGIKVIPNAIITDKVKTNKFTFKKSKIKITFVGRLYEYKGFDSFLSSIERYNNSNSDLVEFIIVGYGKMESLAKNFAQNYKNVTFLGTINNEDIFSHLSDVDVSVHLNSSNEYGGGSGVSNSLVESIFAGNLIICWDNQTYNQVLNKNEAVFIPEGDINALVEVYNDLHNNRNFYVKLVNESYKKRSLYSFDNHLQSFLSLIQSNH